MKRLPLEKQQLVAMLDCIDEGVIAVGLEGRVEYVNAAGEAILRCPALELIGKELFSVFSIVDPETGLSLDHPFSSGSESHDETIRLDEALITDGRGSRTLVTLKLSPLRTPTEGVIGYMAVFGDIAVSKRDVSEWMLVEERYRVLAEKARDIILFVEPDGKIIEANNTALLAYGYSRDELLSMTIQDLRPEDDVVEQQLDQANKNGIAFEAIHTRKDGSTFPVEVSAQSTVMHGQQFIISIIRDVTDRKQVERERQKAADMYRALFDTATDAFYLYELVDDPRVVGRIVEVNSILCERLGYTRDELIDSPISTINKRRDEEFYEELLGQIVHKRNHTYLNVHLTKSGKEVPIEVNAHFMEMDGKRYVFSLARDITDRLEASQLIEESRAKYQALLMNMNVGFSYFELIRDDDGQVIDALTIEANKYVEQFCGFQPGTAVGMSLRDAFGDLIVRYRDAVIELCHSSGSLQIDELYFEHVGKWASVFVYSLQPESFAVLLTDITEKKRFADQVLMAKEVAETASRSKSEFLANMSHEIRTPINGIVGMIDLTLMSELDEEQRDNLITAKNCTSSLLNIINDVLDFSKMEAGKLKIEQVSFNLRQLVDEIIRTQGVRANQKDVELSYSLSSSIQPYLQGDPHRLRQVLDNLLNNAIKFTDRGEIGVSVRMVSTDDDVQVLKFSVSDTGIGISADNQKRLFQSFSQVDGSFTRKFGGTGLGLAICKQLVELMGGSIWMESEEGRGSIFHFVIPFSAGIREDSPKVVQSLAKRAARSATVLLVEDDSVNQIVVSRMLKESGHVVHLASDGFEALAAYEKRPYDVILMDIQMPGMDGIEATKQIRQMEAGQKYTPVVALTAFALHGDRERFLSFGMDEYVSKPVKMDELNRVIEQMLGSREQNFSMVPRLDENGQLVFVAPPLKTTREELTRIISDIEATVIALHSAIGARHLQESERLANKLKQLLSDAEAEELKNIAFKVELAARRGDLPQAMEYAVQLGEALTTYKKSQGGL